MKFLWLLLYLQAFGIVGVQGEQVLVWEDTFDGDSLNETTWVVKTGNGCDQGDGLCGWGNDEQQTYTQDNHRVVNGALWITADKVKELVDERSYTSSRIRSSPHVSFLTGRIEARIKLPAGLGLWAAFWMLPANSTRGNWAATGEIDIMESVNDMETIFGTIHYGGEHPANRHAGCVSGQLGSDVVYSDDYHVYAIEWEQDEMRWYVDEQLFCLRTKWTSDLASYAPYRAPFDTEFEIILNLAVGGNWPGRIVDDSIFPATMLVDYVRVYDVSTDVEGAEPFLGLPACLPGVIQAEAFDTGGLGLGYGVMQLEDESGTYRVDGAGLVYTAAGRTFVSNVMDTDWLAYTVITDEASYDVTLQVSSTEASELELIIGDGVNCTNPGDGSTSGRVTASATGWDGSWGTVVVSGVAMPAGTHSLKLCVFGGVGIKVDSMEFESVDGAAASTLTSGECATSGQSRPFMSGEPWVIPGYMEAEYYDYGGQGVSYHKNDPGTFYGDSALRLPDAVGVVEADSNPFNGQYVGYWDTGEWIAWTARADVGAFWDVGASVASGTNDTSIEFRVLVNATNCSSADTDGWNGLGDEGVDLLDGPLLRGFTGSWEAFEMVTKEEVYVPAGTHRFLFCADDGVFNMNFLRVWTPAPTLAPTIAPTIAPTPAPQAPKDDGLNVKWIYIGAAIAVAILACSRMGCIIYTKEKNNRRMPPPESPKAAYTGSKSVATALADNFESVPSDYAAWVGDGGGGPSLSKKVHSSSNRGMGKAAGVSSAAAVDGHGNASHAALSHRHQYSDLFGPRREVSRRRSSSLQNAQAEAVDQTQRGHVVSSKNFGNAGTASPHQSSQRPALSKTATPGAFRHISARSSRPRPPISRSNSTAPALPRCSPIGGGPADDNGPQNAWKKSGLEVFHSGSLWDRGVVSPLKPREKGASTPSSPKATGTGHPTPEQKHDRPRRRSSTSTSAERDRFEDALIRALTDKLVGARAGPGGGNGYAGPPQRQPQPQPRPKPVISRSKSSPDAQRNPMLMAVKTWTCVCTFENSKGQTACLGCGRVAPLSRPTTPSRVKLLPQHRMNSRIDTPADADL